MKPRVFIVGAGRLGGALALALSRAGWDVATRSRTSKRRREREKLGIPGERFPLSKASVVLLCVPDAAIGEAGEALADELAKGQIVAHCSGATGLEPLDPLKEHGAHVGSMHPLAAVPSPLASLEGAVAAVDGDATAIRILTRLARAAQLKPFRLPSEKRVLYHSAAVVASNGLVALADEAARLLDQCGLPPKQAVGALLPLMQSALDGLKARGLPNGMTGPVARGDDAVVKRHLDELEKHSPQTLVLYRALTSALLRAAEGLESGDVQGRARIGSMLRGTTSRR